MRIITKVSRRSNKGLTAGAFAFRAMCFFLVACMLGLLLLASPALTPRAHAQELPEYLLGQVLSGLASGSAEGLFDLLAGHSDIQEILDKLDEIEDKLDGIATQLNQIEKELKGLFQQLKIDTNKMETLIE